MNSVVLSSRKAVVARPANSRRSALTRAVRNGSRVNMAGMQVGALEEEERKKRERERKETKESKQARRSVCVFQLVLQAFPRVSSVTSEV